MVSQVASGVTLPIRNGRVPPEGARSLGVVFRIDSSQQAMVELDLQSLGLSFIQSVFVDNSGNANPVTLEIAGTGQTISALGRVQGFFPLLSPLGKLKVSCATQGTATIPCQFFNVPFAPFTYAAQPASVTVTGVVPITGNVTVQGNVKAAQSGTWNVEAVQSGAWNVGAAQSGPWSVDAVQSGPWSVNAAQSGAWRDVGISGARLAAYGTTVATQIVLGPARLWMASVVTGGGAGVVYDSNGPTNPIVSIAGALGTIVIFPGGWPCANGIYLAPGAGQAVSLSYTT